MCLIAIAHRVHERYPLVFAANRDEYTARPAAPMTWWSGEPALLAGRDLEAGGTWLGVTGAGRYAAVTNYRDPALQRLGAPSRGALVPALLRSRAPLVASVHAAVEAGAGANPYNLLAGEGESLLYYASVTGELRRLGPGLHLLSNHLLDTPWPKLRRVRNGWAKALADLPAISGLRALFADRALADEADLPRTGIPPDWERALSAVHIRAPGYGTRCTTIGLLDADGAWQWHEWSYGPQGEPAGEAHFRWPAAG